MLKNSVQDKLDGSYIETAIFGLLKINILNLIQLKAILAKEFHILPSEFEIMPYWEYELFVQYINDSVKEQNEKQLAEMDKYHVNDTMKNINSGNYGKITGIPKGPQIPDMSKMSMSNMSNIKF